MRAIIGEYGYGKSHIVELTAQEALQRKFLVGVRPACIYKNCRPTGPLTFTACLCAAYATRRATSGDRAAAASRGGCAPAAGRIAGTCPDRERSPGGGAGRAEQHYQHPPADGLGVIGLWGWAASKVHEQSHAQRCEVSIYLSAGQQRVPDVLSAQRCQRAGTSGRLLGPRASSTRPRATPYFCPTSSLKPPSFSVW